MCPLPSPVAEVLEVADVLLLAGRGAGFGLFWSCTCFWSCTSFKTDLDLGSFFVSEGLGDTVVSIFGGFTASFSLVSSLGALSYKIFNLLLKA